MKNVFIFLVVILLLPSCGKQLHLIRHSVEGYVYNVKTKKPLDSVKIGFLIETSNGNNQKFEKVFFSNKIGYFEIPKVEIKTHYEGAKTLRMIYNLNLKLEKRNYEGKIINIRDTIYTIDKEKNIIYLDTIFLKPINN